MQANNVRKISAITKVLKRPNRYIGAVQAVQEMRYYLQDMKIVKKEIKFVPGLIKIIREVIDNSIDEGVRTKYNFANKIDIVIKDDFISVQDNGRGIPIIPIESDDDVSIDMMMPEGAWTELDAGSNFDDEEDNATLGQNGEGVSLTCIFSKKFTGVTINGGKIFTLEAKDNLSEKETKVGKSSKTPGTLVRFLPDYEIFGLTGFTKIHEEILAYDVLNLALMYPKIKFSINGTPIKAKNFKDYIDMYSNFYDGTPEIIEVRGLKIAITNNPNDNFEFVHYINGLNVNNGGKPLNWAMNAIAGKLTDKIAKKYPNIKSGDVKNKLFAVVLFDGMFNPRFEDQIKSVCSNTYTQFKTQIDEPDFDKLVDRLHKNKDIIGPITEVYRIKEEFAKRKELAGLEKKTKRIKSEKYFPATGIKKYLVICEGACLHKDTPIMRENFIVDEICNLSAQDKIISGDGSVQEVISVTKSIKETFNIRTDTTSISSSGKHRFYIYDTKNKEFDFLSVNEIRKDIARYKMVKSKVNDEMLYSEVLEHKNETLYLENGIIKYTNNDYFMVWDKGTFNRMHASKIKMGVYILFNL